MVCVRDMSTRMTIKRLNKYKLGVKPPLDEQPLPTVDFDLHGGGAAVGGGRVRLGSLQGLLEPRAVHVALRRPKGDVPHAGGELEGATRLVRLLGDLNPPRTRPQRNGV